MICCFWSIRQVCESFLVLFYMYYVPLHSKSLWISS
uniref:Uncharacterized protein n=1 Tax=Anguilla anguilla TaxID=7936 RepID=A0A0E9QQ22_ANGAN